MKLRYLFAALFLLCIPAFGQISRIGSCNAATTSCTPPVHAIGDLFIAYAGRDGSSSAPTLPSGWTSVTTQSLNGTGSADSASRLACKVATTAAETVTGFANADHLVAVVYRGQREGLTAVCASAILGTPVAFASTVNITTTTETFKAETSGGSNSWVAGFGYCSACTAGINTAPAGMTNVDSNGAGPAIGAHDTNTTAASFSSANVTLTTAGRIFTEVIEIKARYEINNFLPGLALAGVSIPEQCVTPTGSNFRESWGDAAASCWSGGPVTCDHTWTVTNGTGQSIISSPALSPKNTACLNSLQMVLPGTAADISATFTSITTNFDAEGAVYLSSITLGSDGEGTDIICFPPSTADCDTAAVLHLQYWRVSTSQYALRASGSTGSSTMNVGTGAWHTFTLHRDTTVANCSLSVDGGAASTFTCNSGNPAMVYAGQNHFGTDGTATFVLGNLNF